jgi:uncharacterized protein YdeI (YjbR/CyaY-like superfamily)
MPELASKLMKVFATPKALGKWLEKHHASESELYIKVLKKDSGVPSVSWEEIVVEALCWGWIDGVKKSLDVDAYVQRITPRKARSSWSKKNTEHVERLIAEGRMQEPGLVHVLAAKADGRWQAAYAPASQMTVPTDFLNAFASKPKLKAFFDTLDKSNKYVIAYGLATAKKPETRQRRFDKFIEMLAHQEKPDFGFSKKKKAQ